MYRTMYLLREEIVQDFIIHYPIIFLKTMYLFITVFLYCIHIFYYYIFIGIIRLVLKLKLI